MRASCRIPKESRIISVKRQKRGCGHPQRAGRSGCQNKSLLPARVDLDGWASCWKPGWDGWRWKTPPPELGSPNINTIFSCCT